MRESWSCCCIIVLKKEKQHSCCTAVVDVVLTLTRIIKSVVTGQAPVTLELRNTLGENTNYPKVVHAYITADATRASARNIETHNSEIESQPTMRQVHTGAYASLLPTKKPTIPLAIQERRPRIYYT